VLLRVAPAYIDVLPLYVAMLAVTPLLLWMLRRGLWLMVAAASVVLFAFGLRDPDALSPAASVEFPFLLWQAFFVAGLLFSLVVPRLDRGAAAWRRATFAAWTAFAAMTLLAYGPRLELFPAPTFVRFAKVPLTTGELLRYLAATLVVVTTSATAWHRLRSMPAAAAVVTLGRRSLAVYGGHVFVQMAAVGLVAPLWWIGSTQSLVVVPVLAALWLCARGIDAWKAAERPAREMRRVLRGWGAPPAGVVAAACLIAFVRLTVPEIDDLPAADQIVDVELQGPDIDLVDAGEEPGAVETDAPPGPADPVVEEPNIAENDEAPNQSGITAPLYV
jgi:hypothetical protein